MSDSDEKTLRERLDEVIAQKEARAELVTRLGSGFEQLLKNIETAESDLGKYIEAQKANDDTQCLVLQFLTSHFALKAGTYGGGVSIGHATLPVTAFGIIQSRVLAGFHSGLMKHREFCQRSCEAAAPMEEFLGSMAALMTRMQNLETDALMQLAPRDDKGNPTVN